MVAFTFTEKASTLLQVAFTFTIHTMCEGCIGARPARTSRFLKAKKLPDDILPKELAHTLPTLRAIFRNCDNRAKSIREMSEQLGCSYKAAEYKYYADRKNLLKYFSVRPRK